MDSKIKNIAVLGSTGSIGKQTLEVAAANPERVKIKSLAANTSDELLEEQIKLFNPDIVALADEEAAKRLQRRYVGKTKILSGEEGLLEVASYAGVDTVLAAMVGYSGLRPTLTAIEHGKDIALANKETLVAAGSIVMDAVKKHDVALLPVDSEHSAIFQSLAGGAHGEVAKLIITASGGPFLGKTKADLESITVDDCLKHPNWSMGKKITVDSSTLANKGLEVIEAHWLFDMPYDKIEVVVHPQSIVHSMVEYVDGSVLAQLGMPDMRLPIQYAFSYPERYANAFEKIDFVKCGQLTFLQPDTETFPMLSLAIECGRTGGTLPCAYNAANEEAVYAFLSGKIKYLDIAKITEKIIEKHNVISNPTLTEIEFTDRETRKETKRIIDII